MNMNRYLSIFLLGMLAVFAPVTQSWASGHTSDGKFDAKELIFGHIGDAYEWHITDVGDEAIAIPLPVLVYSSSTGFHAFLSNRLEEGEYEGLYIAREGDYAGKIVERDASGQEVRPLDFSITKNVCAILITGALLCWIILATASWYRRHKVDDDAPRGGVGLMEMLVSMILEGVIIPSVGPNYRKFAPYLLTVFFFILLSNLLGLVPVFPGGANVTGNLAVTFVLALLTFIFVNVFGTREYWKEIFWPEVPTWLKCPVPFMPLIEFFGIFTKPFALMVRLFANILAGHAIALSLMSIIFITATMGAALHAGMTLVSILFAVFMDMLELLVAFLQAYVFTMLSSVFIGAAQVQPHQEKHEKE